MFAPYYNVEGRVTPFMVYDGPSEVPCRASTLAGMTEEFETMGTDSETAEPITLETTIGGSPVVSIVIPAYGHQDLIGRTLDSVFAQTWTDYEIIVVNDGSPDDTEAMLQPLIETGRIRYVRQENAGVAKARNLGMRMARGEFIALLDDDDLWPPHKLAVQVELMRSNPGAALVYGNLIHIDVNDAPFVPYDWEGKPLFVRCQGLDNLGPSGQVFAAFVEENWIISPGQTLIRRSKLMEMGEALLDPTIWGADDWDLWLRLADRGDVLYCSEIALHYRLHANNTSRNVPRMNANCLKVLRKHSKQQRCYPERLRILTETYAKWLDVDSGHLFYCALRAYQQGEFGDGMRQLSFLAKANPGAIQSEQYRALFVEIWRGRLYKQGDFHDCIRQLRFLAKIDPDIIQNESYCTLFIEICKHLLYEQGDLHTCVSQLRFLAKIDPDIIQNESYCTLFTEICRYCLYQQGEFHTCMRQLRLLAKIDAVVVANEAYCTLFIEICRHHLYERGDSHACMRQLSFLAMVNPDIIQSAPYFTLFIEICRHRLYERGDFHTCIRQLHLIAKSNPGVIQDEPYFTLFGEVCRWLCYKQRDFHTCMRQLLLIAKVHPEVVWYEPYCTLFAEVWRYRLYQHGDFYACMRELRMLAKINPSIIQGEPYRTLSTEIRRWFWNKIKPGRILNKLIRLTETAKNILNQ